MHISAFLILSCGYMLAAAERSFGRHTIVLYFDAKAENFTEPSTSSNSTSYKVGDIIEAYCIQNSTSYNVRWVHSNKKDNVQLGHIDQCTKRKCVLKMTLELFDHNTDLLCYVYMDNGEPIVSKSHRIVLNDIDQQKISKKEEIVKNTPYYTIQCEENDFSVYLFPNGTNTCNKRTKTNVYKKVDRDNEKTIENNIRALCMTFENSNLENLPDYDVFTRRIYNRKIFIMDTLNEPEGNWTIIGSICGGAVFVVALVLYTCTRFFSKAKKHENKDEDSNVHVYEDIELPSTANSTEYLDYSYAYDHRIRANRTGKSLGSCFGSR